MSIRNPNLREKYLDGGKLFRKYFEMGDVKSIGRLTKFAISQNMTSSTGQKPTQMGVWKSMWRWASLKENSEIAWQIVQEYNAYKSWSEFCADMKDKILTAWQHPTNKKYEKFLKENGWI